MCRFLQVHQCHSEQHGSHNSRGVQCADCICGSIHRILERDESVYFDLIRQNIIICRELFRIAGRIQFSVFHKRFTYFNFYEVHSHNM
ncbi:DUF3800 domain-containing protein [Methanothrix sp.]|uniref:DUF3800 domain-containing protein n=1 Tax=Methanothrix sp. TaxID=90426 RepID=UPI003BB044B8